MRWTCCMDDECNNVAAQSSAFCEFSSVLRVLQISNAQGRSTKFHSCVMRCNKQLMGPLFKWCLAFSIAAPCQKSFHCIWQGNVCWISALCCKKLLFFDWLRQPTITIVRLTRPEICVAVLSQLTSIRGRCVLGREPVPSWPPDTACSSASHMPRSQCSKMSLMHVHGCGHTEWVCATMIADGFQPQTCAGAWCRMS